MTNENNIGLVGAVYDVNAGEVLFKDFSSTITCFDKKKSDQLEEKLHQLYTL